MKNILLALVLIFSFASTVIAEDISVEATVNTTSVDLGSSLKLTVTINGANTVPPVQLPKMDGLETRYLGPSSRISIINGQMSRSTGLMFTVIPQKTGQLQVPAITITIDGKDYVTRPIAITVSNSTALNSGSANATNITSPTALQDKLFIVLGTPKKEAYISEPIVLVIKFFYNDIAVKNIQYPTFEHDGFTVEDFGEPRRGQQILGNINYQIMEFRTLIYPTRTGELSLGPAKLGANILIKNSSASRMPGEFGDIFSDDIFDNFLGRFETQTIMLESAKIGINILPVPEEGKPAEFSGGVGKFNFEMTVSPTTIKVGDPVTVRMRIAGDGNLKSVNMPAFKDSKDFKVYDPKIIEQNGEKILEQVVIPNHEKVTQLPEVNFSYFDVVDKQYRTVIKGPFDLVVSSLAKGEETKVVGNSALNPSTTVSSVLEELGQDIRFIKEESGRWQKRGYILYQDFRFILVTCILYIGWLCLFINYEFKRRLTTDIRLARRLHAPKQVRQGLLQAGRFLKDKDARNFYDCIFKTLQEYFGNKFHLAAGVITVEKIIEQMRAKDQQNLIVVSVREIFAECELVRFASIQVLEDKMSLTYKKTQEIIDFFERNYK